MNKRFLACLVLVAVALCAIPAFSASFKEVQTKAKKGDAQAQWELGMMYYKGEGTKKNVSEAFKWWLKAAQQGHADAQCAVGTLYDNGEGVKQNHKEGFKWWLKAANNGNISAQNMLAMFYDVGYEAAGIKPNKAESEKWRKKATEPRNNLSQHERLTQAINYYFGQGVATDKNKAKKMLTELAEEGYDPGQTTLGNFCYNEGNYDEAFKWLSKAAEQGNFTAQYKLSVMYRNGRGVAKNPKEADKWYRKAVAQNPDLVNTLEDADKDVEEAKQTVKNANRFVEASNLLSGNEQDRAKAAKIFTELANDGDIDSQFMLGLYYEEEKNYSEAVKWYRKSAEQGYALSQNRLAIMYEFGEGVKQDKSEAFKWYKKAADQGDEYAYFNLASMYEKGIGVKQNKSEAFKYYMKAAEKGNVSAKFNVATMYYNGEGVKKDYKKAAEWYRKSAEENGLDISQFILGKMYYKGEGVKKSEKEALKWWRMAEKSKNPHILEAIRCYKEVSKSREEIAAAQKAIRELKASQSSAEFWQGVNTFTEVLNVFNTMANIFSGRSSSTGVASASTTSPSKRTKTLSSGKVVTYTARTTPRGNCSRCGGDGMCHFCMWSFPSKENWCHVCGGSAKCDWCHGTGSD